MGYRLKRVHVAYVDPLSSFCGLGTSLKLLCGVQKDC